MGALKRATVSLLEADATLPERLCAQLVGACPDALRREDGTLPTLQEVCEEVGLTYGGLLTWLDADEGGGRWDRFRRALEVRGRLLAEDALRIADDVPPDEVAKANLRVNTRFRLARAYSPRVFGDTDTRGLNVPLVSISIGVAWPPSCQAVEREVKEVIGGVDGG